MQHPGLPPSTTVYDALGRVTQVTDGVNPNPTLYRYSALRLDSLTDARGQTWRFNYNALGWLTSRIDPAGRRDSFAYDVEGQLRRAVNRRGQSIELTYDALHRRLTRTGSAISPDMLSYSSDGRVIAASNAVAVDSTFLNSRLEPEMVRTRFRSPGDPSRMYERRYWYQAAKPLLDSVTATGPYLTLLSRGYAYTPNRGTLDSLRLGSGGWTRLHRNSELAVDTTRFPNNNILALGYVTADELDQLSSPLMDDRYSRDTQGRLAQAQHRMDNTMRAFQYDSLARVRRIYFGDPNYMQCQDDPDFGTNCAMYVDSAAYFDFDGNVTSRTCGAENAIFNWSADGRLTGYTVSGGASVALHYDAAGRLVRRDTNGVAASYFLWDGENLLAELNGAQYLEAQYSYYPGLDRLHAFNRGGTVSYAQQDAEGNVRFLGTNYVDLFRSYRYDESGNLVGGSDVGNFNGIDRARWKGALHLAPDVGLYYMRARWYEPRTGRFMSEDPIGLAGGINPYVFAGNDGVNGADPTGMDQCSGEGGHWEYDYAWSERDEVVTGTKWWHDCGAPLSDELFWATAERLCGYNPSPNCVPWGLETPQGVPLAHAIHYEPVASCDLPPEVVPQLDRQFSEARLENRERIGPAQLSLTLAPLIILRNGTTSAGEKYASMPGSLVSHAIAIWHVHQFLNGIQGPSGSDSAVAVNTGRVGWLMSRDSMYVLTPNGKAYGCAR